MKRPVFNWTRWFYGVTHISIYRGGYFGNGHDVATIRRFPDGTCHLWLYNTHDKTLRDDYKPKTYHKTVEAAMRKVERHYGIRTIAPTAAMPSNCDSNPKL